MPGYYLGKVSAGKEFQKTVSWSLSYISTSWSEPRMHPWIWIGCWYLQLFLASSLFCQARTRMWSKVHNSLPVRRECSWVLPVPSFSRDDVATGVMLIGNCKLLLWLHKHSILQGSNTNHRISRRFNARIDQTRIINLSSRRIIILEDMIWIIQMTQHDLPSHICALISRIQINIASYIDIGTNKFSGVS